MNLFAVLLLLSLGAVEGLAFWWMHPAPVGLCQPVLAYRPREVKAQTPKSETLKEEAAAQSFSPISASQHFSVSASTHKPLPEIYDKAAPMLRCSSGQVFRVDPNDSLTLHCAFFEWDGTDTGSVLEAFRHMPEACMGSIGMQLVSKEKPIPYVVGRGGPPRPLVANGAESERRSQGAGDRGQEENIEHPTSNIELRSEEKESSAQSSSTTFNFRPSTFHSSSSAHSKSNIQNPTLATPSLLFDHTVFRDPAQGGGAFGPGPQVHAFRAVWVSGLDQSDARQGLSGTEFNRLRTIRLHSALTRFRPAHARVIQGTVRGAPNAEAAWQAFEAHMLADLCFAQEF